MYVYLSKILPLFVMPLGVVSFLLLLALFFSAPQNAPDCGRPAGAGAGCLVDRFHAVRGRADLPPHRKPLSARTDGGHPGRVAA